MVEYQLLMQLNGGTSVQTVYIYLDDSGVLHKKQKYFVYAGYVFFGKNEKDKARREYKKLSDNIKNKLIDCQEVKSFGLAPKHKRSLTNVLKKYESLSVCVDIKRVYNNILENKMSIHRYKDYVLKRAIKAKFNQLIQNGRLNPNEDIHLILNIDEQPTSTNGFYDLKSSIFEELKNGVMNFDYGTIHKPILFANFEVDVFFRDSKNDYLIQAADILANSIWSSHVRAIPRMRNKINHIYLQLP